MDSRPWNTPETFGWVTRSLHWIIALSVIAEVTLVGLKKYVLVGEEHKPLANFLIGGVHKPLGVVILVLSIIALLWHSLNIKPTLPNSVPPWQKIASRAVHALLYACLLVMPISGIIMSAAAGWPVNFFQETITFGITKDLPTADRFFNIHQATAFVLLSLVALHILAAIKHHFIDKNNVLKRMF